VEARLLRKHWLPMRQRLGSPSRRAGQQPTEIPVTVLRDGSEPFAAMLPIAQHSAFVAYKFDPPSLLSGRRRDDPPSGPAVLALVGPDPESVLVDGRVRHLAADERVEIPVDLDAGDVVRFLAKVAHGFAIYERGMEACREYFLPGLILGKTSGALTYVGVAERDPGMPEGSGPHAIIARSEGEFLTVLIQLFRHAASRPPVYQILVGRE
jgi:hypothetical protein